MLSKMQRNEAQIVKMQRIKNLLFLPLLGLLFVISGVILGGIISPVSSPAVAAESDSVGDSEQRRGQSAENVDPALTQVVGKDEKIAPRGQAVEISAGHLDMGAKLIDGKLELMVRDDSAGTPVWRHLSDVVVRVRDAGKLAVPAGKEYEFTQAKGEAWVIPQQQLTGVVWLGWNTQDPALLAASKGGVNLIFGGHQGEGNFSTFVEAGNFSGPQKLWNAAEKKSQPVFIEPNTHTHVNWVFTAAGEHLVRLTAEATISGKTVSDTQIMRFAVGDQANAQKALEMKWENNNNVEAAADTSADSDETERGNSFTLYIGIALVCLAVIVAAAAILVRRRTLQRQAEALQAGKVNE